MVGHKKIRPWWKVFQIMCDNCNVCVNNLYTDEFEVKVFVHQGSVLSPLPFIIVLKALSQQFWTGTPWELLYTDDLVISAESKTELRNLENGKENWKIKVSGWMLVKQRFSLAVMILVPLKTWGVCKKRCWSQFYLLPKLFTLGA